MEMLELRRIISTTLAFCLLCSACGSNTENNLSSSNIMNSDKKSVETSNSDREILLEGYPESRVELIEAEEEALKQIRRNVDDLTFKSFISAQRTWNPGQVITVAFDGGTVEIRQMIEATAEKWTEVANIKFDFRNPSQPSNYREWKTSHADYSAYIRIAFDSSGYWSAIGKESIKKLCAPNSIAKSCYKPNEASMNFQGFVDDLPEDWESTVLHEFGHALGFLHEHQSLSSSCEDEFLWNSEAGYVDRTDEYGQFIPDLQGLRPGVYKVLGGPKNFWSDKRIEFNLKRFSRESDWIFSTFDRDSIMKYHFDWWLYRNPTASEISGCYGPKNVIFSAQDRIAASRAYPHGSADIQKVINERVKVTDKILKLKNLPAKLKEEIKKNIRAMKNQ